MVLPTEVLDHEQSRTLNKEREKYKENTNTKNIITPDKQEKCVVYGAGINDDSRFEESLAQQGCEVHAFDCTSNVKAKAVLNKTFTFHKLCIGNDQKHSGFKSFSQVMRELHHDSVDILKFDIE